MALHVDAILDALVEGGRYTALTRPRLVHRLDKDTSGILILGKSQKAASFLARAFADHSVSKLYWACVLGHPKTNEGKVSLKLTKKEIGQQEKIYVDEEEGKSATTLYTLLDTMNKRISWLGLVPLTGRTHQLRVHCAYMQMPILGDGKYGRHADITRELGISGRHLHLHAREIWVPHPEGSIRKFQAPLPNHMKDTFKLLGFSEKDPQSLRKSTEILLKSHEKR